MRCVDPSERPTAEGAVAMLQDILARNVGSKSSRSRLRAQTETTPERFVYGTMAVAREGYNLLKRYTMG